MSDHVQVREVTKQGVSRWQKIALWLGGAALLGAAAHFGVLGDTLAGTTTVIGPDPRSAQAPARADDTGRSAHADAPSSTTRAGAPEERKEPAREVVAPSASAADLAAPAPAADGESDRPERSPPSDAAPRARDGSSSPAEPAAAPSSSAITADGRVILNLATEVELRKLPGIGHARAQAILSLREKLGRFRRVEELLRVKGIGRKRLAALRPKIVLDPL